MRIAALDGSLTARGTHLPWEELYKRAGDLGLAGLELGVGANYEETKLWSSEGRAALRDAALEAGILTPSVCIHSYWNYSFASDDPEVRQRAERIAREAASAAAEMGATSILIPLTTAENVADDLARERWIAGMKAAAPAAEKAGVSFCLENVGREYADAPEDIAAVVDAIASPAVGVYYDPGNAVHGDFDPLHGIELLGSRIRHVHVKEIDGTYLGEGRVPWPEIIPALTEIGYDGWLVFETDPTDDPVEAVRRNLVYLSNLV